MSNARVAMICGTLLIIDSCGTLPPQTQKVTGHTAVEKVTFSYTVKSDERVLADSETEQVDLADGQFVFRKDEILVGLSHGTKIEDVAERFNVSVVRQLSYPQVIATFDPKTDSHQIPVEPKQIPIPYYIVRPNGLSNESLDDLNDLAKRVGVGGEFKFRSRDAAQLFHRILLITDSLKDSGEGASFECMVGSTNVTHEGGVGSAPSENSPNTSDFWFTAPYTMTYKGAVYNDPNPGGDSIWNHANGTGVTVAILDKGFQGSGEANMPPEIVGYNSYGYWNFNENSSNFKGVNYDGVWHGRSCASLVFAPHDDYKGTVGGAPSATANLYLVNTTSSYVAATYGAANNGCKVVSVSAGYNQGYITTGDAWYQANLFATQQGVTVVCSAGNDGYQPYFVPGAYSQYGVNVCVGAHDRTGANSVWSTSQSSNTANVDIYAPGGGGYGGLTPGLPYDVASAHIPGYSTFQVNRFFGTSAATPIVASICALLRQQGRITNSQSAKNYFVTHYTNYSVGHAMNALYCVQ